MPGEAPERRHLKLVEQQTEDSKEEARVAQRMRELGVTKQDDGTYAFEKPLYYIHGNKERQQIVPMDIIEKEGGRLYLSYEYVTDDPPRDGQKTGRAELPVTSLWFSYEDVQRDDEHPIY